MVAPTTKWGRGITGLYENYGLDVSAPIYASEQALDNAVEGVKAAASWLGQAITDVWHWVRDSGVLKWIVAGVALWVNPLLAVPAWFATRAIERRGSVREVVAEGLKGLAVSLAIAAIILPFTAPAAAGAAAGAGGLSAAGAAQAQSAAANGAQTASAASAAVERGEMTPEQASRVGAQLAELAQHPAIVEAGTEGLTQLGVDVDDPTPQQLSRARVILSELVGDDLSGLSQLTGYAPQTQAAPPPPQQTQAAPPPPQQPDQRGGEPRVYTL